ncbi:glycosyltransferase family 2 protein [Aquiflexum balticum]|nr:glycosyltransferase [Aquiflexum balticum]
MITYSHGLFLEEAINGVLSQQTDADLELLISDDNSSDDTEKIVRGFLENHPKGNVIRYVKHSENLGMSGNFAWTLQNCSGKYIAYCEGDDYWIDPLKIQKQIDFLKNNSDYGFCWTRSKIYNNNSSITQDDPNSKYLVEGNDFGFDFTFENLKNGWYMVMQSLFFESDMIEDLRAHRFKFFRDIYLIVHLLNKKKGYCLNFFGSVYRVHDSGAYSGQSNLNRAISGYQVYKELFEFHQDNKVIFHKYKSFTNQIIYESMKLKKFNLGLSKTIELVGFTHSPKYLLNYFILFFSNLFSK